MACSWNANLDSLILLLKDRLIHIRKEDFVEFCLNNKETRKVAENFLKKRLGLKKNYDVNKKVKIQDFQKKLRLSAYSKTEQEVSLVDNVIDLNENKNFPFASNLISVFFDDNRGRHVIASEDISLGNLLFVEKPYACVSFKDMCGSCCKRIPNSRYKFKCWDCQDVSFCSLKCWEDLRNSVHSFECGFGEFFRCLGIAHLALRIILTASLSFGEFKQLLSQVKKPKVDRDGAVKLSCFYYENVYNLVTNEEKFEFIDLFKYSMTAVLLVLFLENFTDYFSETSPSKDLNLLGSTLLRHILQLICNGHTILDNLFQGTFEDFLNETEQTEEAVGSAIYPSASMMNHSCEPSVSNSFCGNVLVVRAAKKIKKGEEVFNCYGTHVNRMKKSERQKILSQQYFFKCECHACLAPFDVQEKLIALKCDKCEGPSVPTEEDSSVYICRACGENCEVSAENLKKQILFFSQIKQGKFFLDKDVNVALKIFLKSWLLGRDIFYKFNKDLFCAADCVAKCLFLLKDDKCFSFFTFCSVYTEELFGLTSIENIKECLKMAAAAEIQLTTEIKKDPERLKAIILRLQAAVMIVAGHYGLSHQLVKSIDSKLKFWELLIFN